MTLWAVVPVKTLCRGKSRLAGVLNSSERIALSIAIIKKTLSILNQIPEIERIIVISRDPQVVSISEPFGVTNLSEDQGFGLNSALEFAATQLVKNGVDHILIIPADLPLIKQKDVKELISWMDDAPMIVIAPDRKQEGTNALLVSPVQAIPFKFGKDSFKKHILTARKNGIPVKIFNNDNFSLDMDTPEDLEIAHRDYSIANLIP